MKILTLVFLFSITTLTFADEIPAPAPSPSHHARHSCEVAKDCKGATPKYCVACTNGKSGECAHWSCVKHKCEIKTCDQ